MYFLTFHFRCFVANCDSAENPHFNDSADFEFAIKGTCEAFERRRNASTTCKLQDFDPKTSFECKKFVYDDSVMIKTLATDFNLVCDKAEYVAYSENVMFLGKQI